MRYRLALNPAEPAIPIYDVGTSACQNELLPGLRRTASVTARLKLCDVKPHSLLHVIVAAILWYLHVEKLCT